MADRLVFTVIPYTVDYGYAHVEFRFYGWDYPGSLGDEILTLRWQADNHNTVWYGLHWVVNAQYHDGLQKAYNISNRLLNKAKKIAVNEYFEYTPMLFYAAATEIATEVITDRRLNEWVPINEIRASNELVAFSEDWEAAGLGGYHYRVLLPGWATEESVQAAIFKRLSDANEYAVLEKWVLAGKPIYRWPECAVPDFRPVAERIADVELWRVK